MEDGNGRKPDGEGGAHGRTQRLLDRVRALLERETTLTLATAADGEVAAAALYYASTPALELCFLSDDRSRHAVQVTASPAVAVAVHADGRDWDRIEGLQLTGECRPVPDAERPAVERLYLAKFPAVARLLEAPASDDERKVAARFRAGRFYRITPGWIRLIDNTRGFASREEWRR